MIVTPRGLKRGRWDAALAGMIEEEGSTLSRRAASLVAGPVRFEGLSGALPGYCIFALGSDWSAGEKCGHYALHGSLDSLGGFGVTSFDVHGCDSFLRLRVTLDGASAVPLFKREP